MRREPPRAWRVLAVLWGLGLPAAPVLHAQEPQPAPPGDTAVAPPGAAFPTPGARPPEGGRAPGEDGEAEPRDTAVRVAYPAPVELPAGGRALAAYEWDLREQLFSGALSLLDLLEAGLPGFTSVRGSYYAGPHHVVDGLLGAGFLRVRVDGREVLPLEGGQLDLTRISLPPLERVLALRHVDGWTIELTTLRHDRPDAYSRIAAGTGQPGFEQLQGAFTNGFGRALTLGLAIDLLNIDAGERPSDRFDFWGKASWIPAGGRAGVELQYRSESLERVVAGAEDLDRREVFLHARGDLGSGLQGEAFAGTSEVRASGETTARARHAGLSLSGARGGAFGRIGVEVTDAAFLPRVAGEATVGARVAGGVHVEAAARGESWPGLRAGGVRGAVRWTPDLGVGLALAAAGGTGVRGVGVPTARAADSVAFDVAEASAELRPGPFRLVGRAGWQRVDARVPLGTSVDPPGGPRAGGEVRWAEVSGDGPVLPLDRLLGGAPPLRARGTWRYARPLSGTFPAFLPEHTVRGEIFLHGEYFAGNLEVRGALSLERRTEMLAPFGEGETAGLALVPARTTYGWGLLLRIDTVRIWWRVDNLSGAEESDVPGLGFPSVRNAFGLRWEFFN